MRTTKKLIVFTVFQALFCAVAPLILILVGYANTDGGASYKISLGIVALALVIIIVAKNTLLKPRMTALAARIAQHDADLKVESDATRIVNLERELKKDRTVETVINALIPILLFCAMLIACQAMERAVLELSGAIGFTLVSYLIGTVFGVFAAREVHGNHSKK